MSSQISPAEAPEFIAAACIASGFPNLLQFQFQFLLLLLLLLLLEGDREKRLVSNVFALRVIETL